jgi:dipeptidyl aminopeptidase/acylaminoacyl peptidase
VAGFDPHEESAKFDPYCPVRNVDKHYPPTLLLHGDKDTDVPYELSLAMAKELARVGVEHELFTDPGGGHGFDPIPCGGFDRVLSFLKRHLE